MHRSTFVDLNVVVDVLLQRQGFAASRDVLKLGENPGHTLYVSGHTITTLAYLLERDKLTTDQIRHHIGWAIHTFRVVPTTQDILAQALNSPIGDYEDAVIDAAATECHAMAIVTRNGKDFAHSTIPAYTPEAYLTHHKK